MLAHWRRRAFLVGAGAFLLSAAADPALAVDLAKKWEVGGGLAYSVYDNDSTLADDFATSVRGGYNFHTHHGVELSLQFQGTESSTRGNTTTYDVNRWAIDYVFNLKTKKPDTKLAPLILFGVGQMTWDTGEESAGSTLLQTGGGLRVFFKPWFALRFEGRLFHYYGDRDLIPRDQFFGFDTDVGVVFLFGG
jgi:hypothetical protein